MSDPISDIDYFDPMRSALVEAAQAADAGDVPVGAVLLDRSGTIVSRDRNRREELADATAHAEMLVLSSRSRQQGDWRLTGHTLVVTLEPCPMCAGAAVLARLDRIVYGAPDPKAGAAWSLYNSPQDRRLNHRIDLVQGVLAEESRALLENFFSDKRGGDQSPVPSGIDEASEDEGYPRS